MRKKKVEKEANHERWLLTYSDLITLLMIFFVIMFATSKLDKEKYKVMAQSFSVAMGSGANVIGELTPPDPPASSEPIISSAAKEKQKMLEMKGKIQEYLKNNKIDGAVSVTIKDGRGLDVSLNERLFFDVGKADIKPTFEGQLVVIGNMLKSLNNEIAVEGHTDNAPINTFEFKSNWHLSTIRASNVVLLLTEKSGIDSKKISAAGYGEFRPIQSNATEEGRAANRRVELIVITTAFDEVKTEETIK